MNSTRTHFCVIAVFSFFMVFIAGVSWSVPEVWVDDDYNAGTPEWKTTHFDTITTGIYNVDIGGTIHVAAGTYVEDLAVYKSLIIDGASSQTVIVQPVGVQIDPYYWAPTHLLISADNVTVRNIQLSGNESICDEGIMIEDCDNVTIEHCDIHHYNSDAVYALCGVGTDVNTNIEMLNCRIHHIRASNNNIGWNTTVICYENTGGTISDI